MSLPPQSIPAVPEETRRVAQAGFGQRNRYMLMGDVLGTLYRDAEGG